MLEFLTGTSTKQVTLSIDFLDVLSKPTLSNFTPNIVNNQTADSRTAEFGSQSPHAGTNVTMSLHISRRPVYCAAASASTNDASSLHASIIRHGKGRSNCDFCALHHTRPPSLTDTKRGLMRTSARSLHPSHTSHTTTLGQTDTSQTLGSIIDNSPRHSAPTHSIFRPRLATGWPR
ncbi:uncharacterized protein BKA78DRAFT_39328 [Phyllosticta capitalensis]|uniref:uncharacterized protein n=1 Tax=Phyllosticta capitalensis TaxID=121624 RepID=UPI00312E3755